MLDVQMSLVHSLHCDLQEEGQEDEKEEEKDDKEEEGDKEGSDNEKEGDKDEKEDDESKEEDEEKKPAPEIQVQNIPSVQQQLPTLYSKFLYKMVNYSLDIYFDQRHFGNSQI